VLREGYVEAGARAPEKYRIADGEARKSEIAALPEVADVMARIAFSGLLNNGRTDWPVAGEGVEPDAEARLGSYLRIIAGRQLAAADSDGILLGQGVAQALKLSPGDRVTLLLNTTEGASTRRLRCRRRVQTSQGLRRARRPDSSRPRRIATTRDVNNLVVALKATADTDRVAALLKARLAGQRLDVRTWVELNDFYEKTVALYERQFGVLQLITLAMVLLSVANSVNMSVFERVGEFGTMRALGDNTGTVFRLVLAERGAGGRWRDARRDRRYRAQAISAVGPCPAAQCQPGLHHAFIRIVPSLVACLSQ
jgi:putative ABC transport system permease protein